MIKGNIGEERYEISFVPSFKIKTTNKLVENLLRNQTVDTFDMESGRNRVKVKATQGEREAFLVLMELQRFLPKLNITIDGYEVGTSEAEPTEDQNGLKDHALE